MRIGVHARTSGGLEAAARYAADVGCECLQVFAANPMQWRVPARSADETARFRAALDAAALAPLFTHTAYLLNLSGTDAELRRRSVKALAEELAAAEALGASGVVTHVGTYADGDAPSAARRLAEGLAEARERSGAGVALLLEDSAGAGTLFLDRVEHFGLVFEALSDRAGDVGVCLDTCHAHAAGIPVSNARDWATLLDALDDAAGPGRVALVHANDCAGELGSRRDRHAWIGDGAIGAGGFGAMFAEPRLSGACAIMEMPGEAPGKDLENLSRLRELRASCAGP